MKKRNQRDSFVRGTSLGTCCSVAADIADCMLNTGIIFWKWLWSDTKRVPPPSVYSHHFHQLTNIPTKDNTVVTVNLAAVCVLCLHFNVKLKLQLGSMFTAGFGWHLWNRLKSPLGFELHYLCSAALRTSYSSVSAKPQTDCWLYAKGTEGRLYINVTDFS